MIRNLNQSIAGNIRKIRTLKALDTKTVANHLGLSLSAYTKIERGETQIDLERAALIAERLDVSLQDMLSFSSGEMFKENSIHDDTNQPENAWENLMEQLKIKDEQIKAKDQQLMSLCKLLEEVVARHL